jgi:hypothetical protein
MRHVLLALGLPRTPHRRLLLGDPDQHHLTTPTGCGRSLDLRARDRFLVLPLGEVEHRDPVCLGKAMNLGHVRRADLPERRRGRNRETPLPPQVLTHPTHRLQLGHIGLQEDPVDRTTGEPDVISQ